MFPNVLPWHQFSVATERTKLSAGRSSSPIVTVILGSTYRTGTLQKLKRLIFTSWWFIFLSTFRNTFIITGRDCILSGCGLYQQHLSNLSGPVRMLCFFQVLIASRVVGP
jgi:hypothetical protein